MNKRYWLFAFDSYYPRGGMNDFEGSFDSLEDAKKFVKDKNSEEDWYAHAHAFDTVTKETHPIC